MTLWRLVTLTVSWWSALAADVTSSQCEHTFRRQLKTCLFKKSFSGHRHHFTMFSDKRDTNCVLTFGLGLFVPTSRRFWRSRSIVYDMIMIWYDEEVVCCMHTGDECSKAIEDCNNLAPSSSESDINRYCKYCTDQLYFFCPIGPHV